MKRRICKRIMKSNNDSNEIMGMRMYCTIYFLFFLFFLLPSLDEDASSSFFDPSDGSV